MSLFSIIFKPRPFTFFSYGGGKDTRERKRLEDVENEGGHSDSNRGGGNEPRPGDFPFRDIQPTFHQSSENWQKTPRF